MKMMNKILVILVKFHKYLWVIIKYRDKWKKKRKN